MVGLLNFSGDISEDERRQRDMVIGMGLLNAGAGVSAANVPGARGGALISGGATGFNQGMLSAQDLYQKQQQLAAQQQMLQGIQDPQQRALAGAYPEEYAKAQMQAGVKGAAPLTKNNVIQIPGPNGRPVNVRVEDAIGQPVFEGADWPTAVKEYMFAKKSGYNGTFQEFLREFGKKDGVTVKINDGPQYGKPPPGWAITYGKDGEPRMSMISGGPAEKAAAEEKKKNEQSEAARIGDEAAQASVMVTNVREIRELMQDASAPAVGTLSRVPALYSDSNAGKIRSRVATLQSGVALGAMEALKKASASGATGFGAMNVNELNLLISKIGALDPDNTAPEIFLETLNEIERSWMKVADDIRRNVAPERIKELGLDVLLDQVEGGGAPGGARGNDWPVRKIN